VQPHLEVKIVDPETGATVPRGERGELCTKGYSVMHGYWGDDAKTREAIDADGWMHTGDLATMDDEGYCQHRRPHQGHGDPRRREHLPARDRRVFVSRRCACSVCTSVMCVWVVQRPGAECSEQASDSKTCAVPR
jgi:acyl-CoA synthetase (AMP-forming)/AMP-acid ligase II